MKNNKKVVAGKWLLMKRGLYWRPNSHGYTGLKSEAGRYTDEQVAIYRRNDEHTVSIIEAETADEISPSCYPDIAQKHLQGLLSFAKTEIERLTKEREQYFHEATHLAIQNDCLIIRTEAAEKERDMLREALEAQAELSRVGILNAPEGLIERVDTLRKEAIKVIAGE